MQNAVPAEHRDTPKPAERKRPVVTFFKTALKSFSHTGTLFPSSRQACRTICAQLPVKTHTLVEYGSGNGVLTRPLLDALGPDARLWGVEIVDSFVKDLEAMGDPRLSVVSGDVRAFARSLPELAPRGVDAVVSGIPFSFLDEAQRDELVAATKAGLRSGGRFILYQNSPAMMRILKRHFTDVRLHFEPLNLPPYFIMVATR